MRWDQCYERLVFIHDQHWFCIILWPLPKTAPKMVLCDQKWPSMTQNVSVWPRMVLKHFPWEYFMKLCHAGPPWGLFRGPLEPRWPLNRPQGGPIWHIIMYYAPAKCLRAILGHAGTFWVMKGYFGSWRDILGHEGIFWVMKGYFESWRDVLGHEVSSL